MNEPYFLIVSGKAGSGKTQALNALEDMGFFCVDNVPPTIIPVFARMSQQLGRFPRVVVVTDVRAGDTSEEIAQCLEDLNNSGIRYRILFLECSDEVIERRYRETRRKHPLIDSSDGSLSGAIKLERYMLNSIREVSDYRIDTTNLSVKQLREQLISLFAEEPASLMNVRFISFGYKYGIPQESDLLFDVRSLPNPFYEEELKEKTGLEDVVSEFVLDSERSQELIDRIESLLRTMLPLYMKEGKTQVVISIGCTGGRHRSVSVAELLCKYVSSLGFEAMTVHRDIGKVN